MWLTWIDFYKSYWFGISSCGNWKSTQKNQNQLLTFSFWWEPAFCWIRCSLRHLEWSWILISPQLWPWLGAGIGGPGGGGGEQSGGSPLCMLHEDSSLPLHFQSSLWWLLGSYDSFSGDACVPVNLDWHQPLGLQDPRAEPWQLVLSHLSWSLPGPVLQSLQGWSPSMCYGSSSLQFHEEQLWKPHDFLLVPTLAVTCWAQPTICLLPSVLEQFICPERKTILSWLVWL